MIYRLLMFMVYGCLPEELAAWAKKLAQWP